MVNELKAGKSKFINNERKPIFNQSILSFRKQIRPRTGLFFLIIFNSTPEYMYKPSYICTRRL
jgi:hypothetical protein